jgi:hypothetical protein
MSNSPQKQHSTGTEGIASNDSETTTTVEETELIETQ